MQIYFILASPKHAGNVGSIARALKTTGFSHLRIVAPECDYMAKEAQWMAHGSKDILEKAQGFEVLSEAISDLDFVVGTTVRQRYTTFDYKELKDLPGIIANQAYYAKKIGIVFGNESSGLSNDELKLCDVVSTIPLAVTYPSLNLSQAVMIYAYELSQNLKQIPKMKCSEHIVSAKHFKNFKGLLKATLNNLGLDESHKIYDHIFSRLGSLSASDIQLVLEVRSRIEGKLQAKSSPK